MSVPASSSSCAASRRASTPSARATPASSWAASDERRDRAGRPRRRLRRRPAAAPRPHRGLRALRLLPADVPDLRAVGRGDGLAARAHPAHARRPRGGTRARAGAGRRVGQLPRLHGVRDRVPERCAVRQAHRGHACAGGAPLRAPAPGAPQAPRTVRAVPVPVAAARRRALLRPRALRPRPSRPARAEGLAAQGAAAAARAHRGHRHEARQRRLPAGLRPARLLRRRQPRDGRRARRRGLRGVRARVAGLLRRAGAAHRLGRPGARARAPDDRPLRALRDRRRQRGGLRLGDEGLRPRPARRPGVGRARRRVRGEGARRQRVPRLGRARLRAQAARDQDRLPRRLPPRPRAGDPRRAARAAARDPRAGAVRPGGVGAVLRLGGRVQPAQARAGARAGGAQGAQPARHRRPGRRGRQSGLRRADRRLRRSARVSPDGDPARLADRENVVSTETQTRVLTDEALAFVGDLERRFGGRRRELMRARRQRRRQPLDFLDETREIREGDWTVASPAPGLEDRRVEITGPVDRKMMINALNSGARGFMADFEDSLSPTWENIVGGQQNLVDAIDGTIEFGDDYRLDENTATLLVRPRGWHLHEKHRRDMSASLFDAGLYLFHNAQRLVDNGVGPYFYLPKMESHLEARLWNEVFVHAEDTLGLDRGAIRATVLIETLPAAFEMDEILYELREHSAGLNAGRWDYIFSAIKNNPDVVLPQRNDVKMTVPFMRAYTELLVKTCHRRGAHAMGGMAALIPSRKDAEANEKAIAGVRADKEREATDGFDGTWVAHPDLVEVAMPAFPEPNQLDRQRDDVHVTAEQLLDLASTPGEITEEGLRNDVDVGIRYIASWLRGNGA